MKGHIFYELGHSGGNQTQANLQFEKSRELMDNFYGVNKTYDYLEMILDDHKLSILNECIQITLLRITDKNL